MPKTPKNQEGESPTRSTEERDRRLRGKMKEQKGSANRQRTEAKLRSSRDSAGPS